MRRHRNIVISLTDRERLVVRSVLEGYLPDESDPQDARAISRVIDKLRRPDALTVREGAE